MNKLTPEELLRPRVKVIGPYPGSPFKVGQILTLDSFYEIYANGPFCIIEKDEVVKCPNIFQSLEWWEERKEDEMPEYLRQMGRLNFEGIPIPDKIVKVIWHSAMEGGQVFDYAAEEDYYSDFYRYCLPATEGEYKQQTTNNGIR